MSYTFAIDRDKLNRELIKRGLKASDASRSLGCSKTYLNCCMTRGKIGSSPMKILKDEYNIRYEDICPDSELPPIPEKETAVQLDLNTITIQMIEDAVYRGMTRALKGE